MRLFKKVAALLLAVAIAVPTTAFSVAASNASPAEAPIKKGSAVTTTYNGKDKTSLIKFTDESGKTLTKGTDYEITSIQYTDLKGNTKAVDGNLLHAGTYTVTAKGIGSYKGTATTKVTINRAKTTLTLSASKSKYGYNYATFNGKKAINIKIKAKTNSTAKVKYTVGPKAAAAGFSIENGVIKHAKTGYKPGTYKFTYEVAANNDYAGSTKTGSVKKTITVVIKKAYPHIKSSLKGKTTWTVKASDVKKGKQTKTISPKGEEGTKVAYKITESVSKKWLTVKNGVITVKKGAPAGEYPFLVYNTGSRDIYNAGTFTYHVVVK